MDGGDGGFERERVHDFDRARQQPAGDDGGDSIARLLERAVAGEDGVETLRARQELDGDFEGDAEKPLVAVEESAPVGADVFTARAAPLHDLAGGEHGFDPEDVVRGHAVFQAVRAAGVEGDVAADGANGLAGGVGRKVQAVRCRGEGHVEVDHAGLDDGDALRRVEAEDAVEAIERDDDAIRDGKRAAGEAGAAAARDEGQALRVAEADEGDDFVWRLGKSDGQRARAKRREPVAFIRREALRLHEYAPGGEDGGETLKGGGHGSVQ